MAYKFQLGTARLSGSIVPTDDNALDLGESGKEFKDLFIDGTAHLDAINFNGTLISSTAAELNKLDGAGADVTAAKLTTLAALTNTEIGFLDGALSSGVANKAVIMDANKDVGGVRNLTLTGDLTVNGTTTTIDTTTLLVEDSLIEIARGNGGSRASNANAGLYISGSNLDRDVSLQVAADGGRLRVSGSSTVGTGFDIVTGGDYAIGGTSVLNGTTLGSGVLNSSLTSVGTLSTLTVDNVIINGTTIGHTDDGDIITLGDTSVAFANDVDVNIAKAGGLQIAGSAVTATAAELNLLDAGAGSSVAVAAGDGFIMFDATDSNNGKKVLASDIKAYASGLAIYQLSGSGTADGIIGAASGSGYYYNEAQASEQNGLAYEGVYMISGSGWSAGDMIRLKAPDFDTGGKISIYAQSSSLGDFAHSIENIQSDTSGSNMSQLGTDADDEAAIVLESDGAAVSLVMWAKNEEGSLTTFNWAIV